MVTLQTIVEQSSFRLGEATISSEQFLELRAFAEGRSSKVPDSRVISFRAGALVLKDGLLVVYIEATAEDAGDSLLKIFPAIRALVWTRYQRFLKKNELRDSLKQRRLTRINGVRRGKLGIHFSIPISAACDSVESRAARSGFSVVPAAKPEVVMLPGPISGVRPVRIAANA